MGFEYAELILMRIGAMEITLLLILALLIFGGSRLAGLGKALGTSIRDFKKETSGANDNKPEDAAAKAETTAPQAAAPVENTSSGEAPDA
ncbi:MAG: twin-arginine translocase TatA/TatE family subunit [Defluviitaleaceae bacterium]|nr:twin-arginine translocase TatA/TatE family subunit [Defluviitaleaceae bacterium]